MNSLLDDIRVLYKSCGHKGLTSLPYPTLPYPTLIINYPNLNLIMFFFQLLGERITFLFTEGEIKDEGFLEVINSILTTGEVLLTHGSENLFIYSSSTRWI